MELEVLDFKDDRFEALVTEANAAKVNAIRRALMTDVPSLAIDDVTVYDNTSGLFDEIIAHRLGLLPIPTEPQTFNFRPECVCGGEGCPNCIVIYTLSKEGPAIVYSGDLQPQDEAFAVPDPDIPIVELLEDQRLMLEAVASLGRASDHTKWTPVVAPAIHQYPRVVVAANGDEEPVDVAKLCADHVAFRGEAHGVERVAKKECDLCDLLDGGDVDESQLRVTGEPDRYFLRFETDGSMTAREAMKQALGSLMARLDELGDRVGEIG